MRCEACGRVIAPSFPMHACVAEGEERFSVSPLSTGGGEDDFSLGSPIVLGATLEKALEWAAARNDDELCGFRVTRWTYDPENPWGIAAPSRSIGADVFVYEPDIFDRLEG